MGVIMVGKHLDGKILAILTNDYQHRLHSLTALSSLFHPAPSRVAATIFDEEPDRSVPDIKEAELGRRNCLSN
jgi:hypothetical protein